MSKNKESEKNNPLQWERLSKKEINNYQLVKYEGPCHVIKSEKQLEDVIAELKKESILGFDTETRPSFKRGESYLPALLQLATATDVYLFQLTLLNLPPALIPILENPDIVKAGVAIKYDLKELKKLTHFEPGGFVDIAKEAKKLGIKNLGLRGLSAVLLKSRISKTAQMSNWAKKWLTPKQIQYAATDAWIGRKLYKEIIKISEK
ncbi:MAG: 3'-5' exonuclease [Verrucomicrobiota bacterium]|nr:3'-5' exonuclease [Verrucomicrobiota bacterium]